MKKSSKILPGISGEYFVAAELSSCGFIASVTLRNTKGIDILASNQNASRTVAIQVKTNHWESKGGKGWVLNKKAEEYSDDNLFYVFVNLKGESIRPDFYIVPSKMVASYIKEKHAEFLKTPGKHGQQHKNNLVRKFQDSKDEFLEKSELLGLR
jgi:hypothetical protein